ncbi:unnamed protein product [Ceratitis capitata]|uniref:(Mediterranean fruit fly) hypothetical protein n=1 Tax=Ceratitis capitata TaxID=7213 RepID=A0A811UJ88_CERCA|nr:unnamed protein product [Ceratitis capitata]
MEDDEPVIEPLVDSNGLSFPNIVPADEDVTASGSLTNGEVLTAIATNEESDDKNVNDAKNLWQMLVFIHFEKIMSSHYDD